MHRGVTAVVSILAVFVINGTRAVAQSAPAAPHGPVHAVCRSLWQHTLPGQTMKAQVLDDDLDELRLKVCGAWPGCTSCVEMAEGDCRYVFPTNVMVYSENKAGVENICACQVLGCQLPWDPGKWGRKCAVHLGCYPKPSYIRDTGFPAALCGGKGANRRVRFGPLSFAYQTYSSPGIAMLTYEDDKVVDSKYLLFPQVGGYDPENDAVGKDLKLAAKSIGDLSTVIEEVSAKTGKNVLTTKEGSRNLLIYRHGDMICVQDNGELANKGVVDGAGRCFPIPSAPVPVLYARKGTVTPAILAPYHQEKLRLVSEQELQRRGGYREALRESIMTTKTEDFLIQDIRTEYNAKSREDVGTRLIIPVVKAVESLEYKSNGTNAATTGKCQLSRSDDNGTVQLYSLSGLVDRVMKHNIVTRTRRMVCSGYNSRTLQTCLSSREDAILFLGKKGGEVVKVSVYGGIHRFGGYWREDAGMETLGGAAGQKRDLIKRGMLFVPPDKDGICRFLMEHKMKGVTDNKKCEYFHRVGTGAHLGRRSSSAIDRKSVLCPNGVLNVEDMEYEVLSAAYCDEGKYCEFSVEGIGASQQEVPVMMKYYRVRVKKKPKTLRRYAIVNSNGISKRIRCDDRYSIDLYMVSQEVLNSSRVSGNKFKFPMEYLGQSVSEDSKDPCHSSKSNIVYYYEYGGFIAGEEASKKCGNPVEEYYTPEKKVVGCEYDYIRADDYKPFLQGLTSVDSVSVVPLSKYEQGICIDNFEKIWFTPTFLDNEQARKRLVTHFVDEQHSCCSWNGTNGSVRFVNGGTDGKVMVAYHGFDRSRREYVYKISNDVVDDEGEKGKCTLYRVEMWGGGEAASAPGGVKRSGRPGQYVMLALDFAEDKIAKIKGKRVETELRGINGSYVLTRDDGKTTLCPSSGDWECYEYSVGKASDLFLVMEVGNGGDREKQTKGEDTVLSLCNGDDPYKNDRGVMVRDKWKYIPKRRKVRWEECKAGGDCREKVLEVSEKENCYEIARAVGGGSEKLQQPNYAMAKNILVYYRTIHGDVLSGDEASNGLLEGHNAMFTKFSLEMNLSKKGSRGNSDPMSEIVNNRWYFEGRSMPRRFCKWKGSLSESGEVLIPGRGGCWRSASGEHGITEPDSPGVGENGAVMITCERWEKIGDGRQN